MSYIFFGCPQIQQVWQVARIWHSIEDKVVSANELLFDLLETLSMDVKCNLACCYFMVCMA